MPTGTDSRVSSTDLPFRRAMQSIEARDLQVLLASGQQKPRIIDVREPWEFEICHIDGSENVPMTQLAARLAVMDPQPGTVYVCHHGVRSLQVANYAESLGHNTVMNLAGGIDAWAQSVDPAMPRY